MKSDKLQDAIGMVDERLIDRAEDSARKNKKRRYTKWTALVAAVLAFAIGIGVFMGGGNNPIVLNTYAVALAEYPEYEGYNSEYYGKGKDLDGFFKKTISEFLTGAGNENRVYSPLNTYIALSMLAEITAGDSREEILTLLGSESIEALRAQANAVWKANYRNDEKVKSILGSSLWMDEGCEYKQEAVDILKNNYYASTFQGKMGSSDYNKALQSWLNEQTGGLLENHTSKEGFDSLTVIALVSTVYFNARWHEEFLKSKNTDETFHSPSGDITCEFMHQQIDSEYFYWGENFSAIRKTFTAGGSMRFILPNDGVSVDSLLSDEEALALMTSGDLYKNKNGVCINLSMPKFDVDSSLDLQNGLKNLGVRSCFDFDTSDFSPIIEPKGGEGLYVRKVSHGARVKLDEEGVVAAAYTLIDAGNQGGPGDEVDFVLDRPFIFVITNSDGLPLFVGVVNQP